MSPHTFLICGYRQTGKDSLYRSLQQTCDKYSWNVFRNPNLNSENLEGNFIRVAFADILKLKASKKYNIPLAIGDEDKDKKQFIHPNTNLLVSARDLYIELATKKRAKNVNYWCEQISLDSISNDILITDWRFENEFHYLNNKFPSNVHTIRVYRSEVVEPTILPDTLEDTEHNLDNFLTDYLVLRCDDTEFAKATERFPQYKDFVFLQTINPIMS
jgi:hypothetical protein